MQEYPACPFDVPLPLVHLGLRQRFPLCAKAVDKANPHPPSLQTSRPAGGLLRLWTRLSPRANFLSGANRLFAFGG